MNPFLSSPMRIGLIAFGLVVGAEPALATPASIAAPPVQPLAAKADGAPQNVAERDFRRPPGGGWNKGGGRWNNGGGRWNNGNWNHRPNWNNNWRRPYYPGWNNGFYGGWGFYGPQIYLQLGQPYYPYGQYYAQPRRVYRGDILLSAEHVQWCYNRWRSYRAADNTYQPNNGPRRLCVSPYN